MTFDSNHPGASAGRIRPGTLSRDQSGDAAASVAVAAGWDAA
ncbi:hypothetical protein ACFQ9V_14755 [Leifsonia sp. NPDC056665]